MKILEREIVNSHVHLPELNSHLLDSLSNSNHSLLPKDIAMNTIPLIDPDNYIKTIKYVGKSILLPIGIHNLLGDYCPIYASNKFILKLAEKYPNSIIPFGSLNLADKNASDTIKKLESKGIVGIKYHALEGYSLLDCSNALQTLEELNLPIVVHLGDTPFPKVNLDHARPSMIIPILNKFPKLRVMITHFGTPLHFEAFWIASRYENAFMDTAEYPLYWTPHPDNPYGPLLSPLHTKRVGMHKFVFGTDFPMPTLKQIDGKFKIIVHDVQEYLGAFLNLPDNYFTPEEKKSVLCENVWKFIGKSKHEVEDSNRNILVE
jgi:predicted TIM-barrel fold metal-dependent hydrolase